MSQHAGIVNRDIISATDESCFAIEHVAAACGSTNVCHRPVAGSDTERCRLQHWAALGDPLVAEEFTHDVRTFVRASELD